MATALRVLILEDQPADAELLLHELRRAGYAPDWQRVEMEHDYLAQLTPTLDLILADYTLPQFDALRALHCLQERGLDIPFIVVTGAVSEEAAVACMQQGAADYLLKDRLSRLGAAVSRALDKRRLRAQQRQMEDALRASEERLRTVVSNAPVILFALDRTGVVTMAEGKGLEALGFKPGQVVGVSAFDLYPDVPETLEHVRRALAGEAFAALDRLGELEFETHWMPLRDSRSHLDGTIGVATDITERRRAEHRTHAALDALLAMAETIVLAAEEKGVPDGGATGQRLAELTRQVLGCQHVAIVTIAPETEELRGVAIAGFSSDEAPRWWRQWDHRPHLSDRLEAAQIALLHADDALILDRTQPPFPRDTAFERRTVLLVPLRVGEGLSGILSVDHGAVAHDFTPEEIALVRAAGRLVALVLERERLLREQAEARASELALREANRRMEEFLSVAGHEFRTPLTSVLGNVQLAALWIEDLKQAEKEHQESAAGKSSARLTQIGTLLQRMDRQSQVLNGLVNDLLVVSRIQAGRLELRPEPCDLAAHVREIVEEYQQRFLQRRIHLDLPDEAVLVIADAERIGQVLTNFLANALKYSPPTQPITVGLGVDGPAARVRVRDEGPGVPLAEQEHVWERFYRVPGVRHQDGSSVGLGLGLYISRTIIEGHGGQVGVESNPGAGATFWFTLPLAQQAS